MEGKGVSVHGVKAYGGSRGAAPLVFRRVYKIARSDYHLRRVALLSARNSSPPTGWNFIKFCIGGVLEKSGQKILL